MESTETLFDVTFVALQPVENVGVFPYEGTLEEAQAAFEEKLKEVFKEYKILSFSESEQMTLPLEAPEINKEKLN